MKDLVESVCSQIATKYDVIGEALGLNKTFLEKIKDQTQGHKLEGSYTVLLHWLYHSLNPTWKELTDVLASDEVGEFTLANFLNEKFCAPKK